MSTLEQRIVEILDGYFRYSLDVRLDEDIPAAAADVAALVAAVRRRSIPLTPPGGVMTDDHVTWMCGAFQAAGGLLMSYRCTEPYDHEGPHRADIAGETVAEWPRSGAPEETT